MIFNFHYYLLDKVSETILGQFFAKSEVMAKKILSGFDFKKANLDPEDCIVICDSDPARQYETYTEVVESKHCRKVDLLAQNVFDFDGDKNADS